MANDYTTKQIEKQRKIADAIYGLETILDELILEPELQIEIKKLLTKLEKI